jgi:hypothetical protein
MAAEIMLPASELPVPVEIQSNTDDQAAQIQSVEIQLT